MALREAADVKVREIIGELFDKQQRFANSKSRYLAVIGTLSALYRRIDDGIGRHVETSLLDGALVYLSMMWGNHDGSQGGGNPAADTILGTGTNLAFQALTDTTAGALGAGGFIQSGPVTLSVGGEPTTASGSIRMISAARSKRKAWQLSATA